LRRGGEPPSSSARSLQSAVSSPSGIWGKAAAEIDLAVFTFQPCGKSHLLEAVFVRNDTRRTKNTNVLLGCSEQFGIFIDARQIFA